MTVQPNSLAAFASVDITTRQREVLEAIRALHHQNLRPSDQDIAATLRWPINRVTPRRGELMVLDLVLQGGHKTGCSGRRVQWWQPKPEQLAFFEWLDRERPLERAASIGAGPRGGEE